MAPLRTIIIVLISHCYTMIAGSCLAQAHEH
jgi:hypothetical protein